MTLFTVGHSNRTVPELIDLLDTHGIGCVCDVRAYPSSRRLPQFNQGVLAAAVEDAGLRYVWLGKELGGYRKSERADSPHTALDEDWRAYADHMESDLFRAGVQRLLDLAGERAVAYLCAERDWQGCHRRYISDWLVAIANAGVTHLDPTRTHAVSPRARVDGERLVYDLGTQHRLF